MGKVDAVVGDEPVLRYYINNYGISNKYSVLSNPIYTKKAVLAVPKQYEELVSILNKGIFKLQKNGVYKDLKKNGILHIMKLMIYCMSEELYLVFIFL